MGMQSDRISDTLGRSMLSFFKQNGDPETWVVLTVIFVGIALIGFLFYWFESRPFLKRIQAVVDAFIAWAKREGFEHMNVSRFHVAYKTVQSHPVVVQLYPERHPITQKLEFKALVSTFREGEQKAVETKGDVTYSPNRFAFMFGRDISARIGVDAFGTQVQIKVDNTPQAIDKGIARVLAS
ncbi:MAG: hypothetical protein UY72_C0030G0006 [Candidatus Uhrbacteria bacterium GW2011_GWD2_52_7]|uniref:Uncharacterized protein n=1 Tax=Candidatus Uhrbacteria bacterium GW2011_GWD2_52_7 TaxID=1618989 RepID=A0A0G1XF31_9BACT|nr:MAG: hypothetical protein UY72_C0030G0006 [Candidatus Uhrbacteria bacterium GW2011_GWD2_52_7]